MKTLFLAPLSNAFGSFTSLSIPHFKVERWSKLSLINLISSLDGLPDIYIEVELDGDFVTHNSRNYSYVLTGEFDLSSYSDQSFEQYLHYERLLENIIYKMRLFQEGYIDFYKTYFYEAKEDYFELEGSIGKSRKVMDNRYFLSPKGARELSNFVFEFSIPSNLSYVKLAYNSFQESYEVSLHLSFLCLMISIEVLFVGNQELVYRISRGIAILLGKSKKDSERIFTLIKSMYKKRSKLVHEGKSSEITQEDVYALRQIVRECIVKLSKLNLEKEKLDTLLTYSGFGQFKS